MCNFYSSYFLNLGLLMKRLPYCLEPFLLLRQYYLTNVNSLMTCTSADDSIVPHDTSILAFFFTEADSIVSVICLLYCAVSLFIVLASHSRLTLNVVKPKTKSVLLEAKNLQKSFPLYKYLWEYSTKNILLI